jgi:hypothetical protein
MADDICRSKAIWWDETGVESSGVPSIDWRVRVLVRKLDIEARIPDTGNLYACNEAMAIDTGKRCGKDSELLSSEMHSERWLNLQDLLKRKYEQVWGEIKRLSDDRV